MTNQYVNKLILGNETLFDISGDTATAADVAQGKTFHLASGAPAVGTASGGGGTPIVWGRIRGDAELAKSWTYDKLIHADEGITIPAYTSADTTLKSRETIATESLDFANYSYFLLYRSLSMPIYSDSVISAGRNIYHAGSHVYRLMYVPFSAFDHGGISAHGTSNANVFAVLGNNSFYRYAYYNTASSIRFTSGSYGAYSVLGTTPSASASTTSPYDTGTLKITAPDLKIRGNTNYLNSTNWAKITDIRYQYIFELWRVPASDSVHGWEVESQFRHVLDCANGTGTLT